MIIFLMSPPTQLFCDVFIQSVRSRPTVYDLSFVFSTPHHPQNAPQSVPRLYTGNGQVKTQITSSTSLVLGTATRSRFPFRRLSSLLSMHDTFAFGILW